MPIAIIAILVIGAVGIGAYFFTASEPRTEEVIRVEETTDNSQMIEVAEMTDPDPEPAPGFMVEVAEETPTADEPMDSTESAITTFTSAQTYLTPARTSHDIAVTLMVDTTGTVVDASVVYDNGDGFSNGHQERFDGAYKAEVIGKQLSEIELARTGGASLTTEAFNQAVADIETQRS